MLHLALSAPQTTLLLAYQPERAAELVALHEAAHLDLARQMAASGVPAMMAMDNLDSAFHPPSHIEQCSALFYEQVSRICHEYDSAFFIHACGRQRANLALIASLGVDGLEGVAFPPLGDVELDEAMRLSGERLIVTGGISAKEYDLLRSRREIFDYVRDLLLRMEPYAHRFVLAASCVTPFNAPWESILHFRDAWQEYGRLSGGS
jgi:uroporphyrinogen-III decarboxylase